MNLKQSVNTDSREQLTRALEYSILGWHHTIHRGEKHSSTDLLHLLNFLRGVELQKSRGETKNSEKPIAEGSMKTYRNRLKEEFGFYTNFQSGYTEYGEDLNRNEKIKKLLPMASYYFHAILPSHSDEALLLLLKNISEKKGDGSVAPADPLLALYYIVAFRFAALCGLPVDLVYREIMGKEESSRRVIPLAVVWRAPYINLIARDKKDGKIKQFVMSSILSITSNLWSDFFKILTGDQVERENFDYESYKDDPEYRFLRSIRKYTFRMTGFTFHHFRHSYNLDWELVEDRSATEQIVSITSDDWRAMVNLLFNYESFIELIGEEILQEGDEKAPGDMPRECIDKELPLLCALQKQIRGLI